MSAYGSAAYPLKRLPWARSGMNPKGRERNGWFQTGRGQRGRGFWRVLRSLSGRCGHTTSREPDSLASSIKP